MALNLAQALGILVQSAQAHLNGELLSSESDKVLLKESIELLMLTEQKLEQEKDYNYPLLAWHPSGKFISIIYSSKDRILLQIHNLETKEVVERILPGFEKINSCSYNSDGKKIVLSAVKKGKGQSDIFVFKNILILSVNLL